MVPFYGDKWTKLKETVIFDFGRVQQSLSENSWHEVASLHQRAQDGHKTFKVVTVKVGMPSGK